MIADFSGHLLTPDDIVREVKHLPSAPKVLPRLKQLLSDGNSAMHEIVGLIRLDAGIAARVLQVANSAYFGKGLRCITVDEAVHRVGYDQIYELVSYAVASQVLVRPLSTYGVEADDLWRMSVAGALATEALAARTGEDRNIAYTIGLLHCVGMVAIDEWSMTNARHLTFPPAPFPRESTDAERSTFGFTQADAGGALLRHWGFPYSIVEPVRWQYAPRGTASQSKMACLLYAGKWLRHVACGTVLPLPDAGHLAPLHLPPSILPGIAKEVAAELAEINSRLDATTGSVPHREHFPAQAWKS
jgi:HD-like signal output (HDOD) protein